MCVISMIGDHYRDQWQQQPFTTTPFDWLNMVPRAEFDALKREVEQMKALLIKAKIYDEAHGEPECELAEKVALLRKVAELVGVSLDDVLGASADATVT